MKVLKFCLTVTAFDDSHRRPAPNNRRGNNNLANNSRDLGNEINASPNDVVIAVMGEEDISMKHWYYPATSDQQTR